MSGIINYYNTISVYKLLQIIDLFDVLPYIGETVLSFSITNTPSSQFLLLGKGYIFYLYKMSLLSTSITLFAINTTMQIVSIVINAYSYTNTCSCCL